MISGERKIRVLVAEDDPEMRALVAFCLREAGVEVDLACDGRELRAQVAELSADVVISDVRMPGWNGMEALTWLSMNRPEIPVILITGYGDPRTHVRARELGAVAVYDKPVDVGELRRMVLSLVRAHEEVRRVCGNRDNSSRA